MCWPAAAQVAGRLSGSVVNLSDEPIGSAKISLILPGGIQPAGQIGGLQQRMFSGPWTFNLDFALLKATRISEQHSLELRVEASNVFNHPTWLVGDQQISSVNFGRIASAFYDRRLVQFSLHYRF
jgi:hypothetical protein